MENKEYDIFISYSQKDATIVNSFYSALCEVGYSVFIDKNGICSGAQFAEVIVDAIKRSKVILFFSSDNAKQSRWTKREIHTADEMGKNVIPIKLDPSSFEPSVGLVLAGVDFIEYNKTSVPVSACVKRIQNTMEHLGFDKVEMNREPDSKLLETKGNDYVALTYFGMFAQTILLLLCLGVCIWLLLYGVVSFNSQKELKFLDVILAFTIISMIVATLKIHKNAYMQWSFWILDALGLYLLFRISANIYELGAHSKHWIYDYITGLGSYVIMYGYIKTFILFLPIYIVHNTLIYIILHAKLLKVKNLK